ncbi:tRNA1(Val) (adenine(37)-N6)-methyltransferase [Pseudochelatococcus contaminans]|uniref:tRNA1(Val) A37 N6-methylase TrmN6 n=1 Tax=Pseudochelatococcus contaminans TaxID=1538103 RepID=A0A7W6EGK2_9HYPH|nr:methyltransferase [Pseudochelatococcus contaminans]MBB3809496.1 tRNA1(Val) A37 N6-methylase TrmN6 [Pseudochelatococcus contaminans]
MTAPFPDVVEDRLLGERLRLLQPRRGHRAGTDALLLAAVVPSDFNGHIADLGAGVGTVGLVAAVRAPGARVTLAERHAGALDLAERNITLNGLGERVCAASVDLFSATSRREAGLRDNVDLVLTNPPFHDDSHVRRSPDEARRAAHVLAGGTLDDWLRACADVLRPGGVVVVVHRSDILADLLACMTGRFGGLTVRSVHPRAQAPAVRVLLAGVKGSRAPLQVLPPIVAHEEDGRFTPALAAIGRGEGQVAISG